MRLHLDIAAQLLLLPLRQSDFDKASLCVSDTIFTPRRCVTQNVMPVLRSCGTLMELIIQRSVTGTINLSSLPHWKMASDHKEPRRFFFFFSFFFLFFLHPMMLISFASFYSFVTAATSIIYLFVGVDKAAGMSAVRSCRETSRHISPHIKFIVTSSVPSPVFPRRLLSRRAGADGGLN